jgi:glycosyltransferase involved in cell wall biosynthesis
MGTRPVADSQPQCTMSIKLGIWCDYGITLEPSEGIGVFVANLVQGLIEQPTIERVVLVAKEGQEQLLEPLKQLNPDIVQIVGNTKPPFYLRKPWKYLRQADRRTLEQTGKSLRDSGLKGMLYRWLSHRIERSKSGWINQVDLWLLPYVGLDQEFTKPTVVIVHDLVTYHFSDGSSEEKLGAFKRLVNQVTSRARIVACMSDFILENDLHGTLGLSPNKTCMVRPAVPRDFARCAEQSVSIPEQIPTKRYLLYPAAFRSYKNHALLLSALAVLNRDRKDPYHLVFTGITNTPENLQKLINDLNIEPWVHVLGKVPRSELQALYRQAFATAVPSLYEQGSFPLMEALSFGCPILCSDIPSLREQLSAMNDEDLFFDPHCSDSFVQAVDKLQANRDARLADQLAGFERMKQRTWSDAAKQWCEVFRQALDQTDG